MKRLRPAIRPYSGLLLAGAVLFQVTLLPAQAPSVRQLADSGQAIPIAVMDFDGFGISQVEAIALSNRLRNELFRLGTFEVVDRGMMENILTEQDFQMAGCTSNECLVEVGQLLGARRMVGGSISKVGAMFTVSARVVDVQTGKLLGVSDFDIRGGLEEMLTDGMEQVALMLSGDESARALAEQQAPQPDQPAVELRETEAQQGRLVFPTRPTQPKPRRWQSRIGFEVSNGYGFSVPFSYDLSREFNLWGIHLQPVVSGGVLELGRSFEWDEEWEDILYGMLEIHRKGSTSGGKLGAAIYLGIGVGLSDYQYYSDHVYLSDVGISFLFTAGAQARAKLSILPTLVGDVSLIATPNSGSSVMLSFGAQSSFIGLASIWGAVFLTIIAVEGGW